MKQQKSRVVTLSTDFGDKMGYVAQMKGVMLSINPQLQIVDIDHHLPPHDIAAASLVLEQCHSYFPTGTIHVAVIDPGVGTRRRAISLQTETAFFVGPDNGLFGFLEKDHKVRSARRLTNERYFLDKQSRTFHGRDIFAPVAAYISLGYPCDEFGPLLDHVLTLAADRVKRIDGEIHGEVVAIDDFGNLITSIPQEDLDGYMFENSEREVFAYLGGQLIPIHNTFGNVPEGEILAYIGSGDRLEVAVNRGSAEKLLKASTGQQVKLITI